MTMRYLLVGLGNPGLRYHNTRHNMGFLVIDYLSQKYKVKMKKNRLAALAGEAMVDGKKIILAKPLTYMNNSGESVLSLMRYYDVAPEGLVVVYDDMDIAPGEIRIRKKGSAGTHNGMRSVIFHLQDDAFIRVRVGIGKPLREDAVSYVLGKIPRSQQKVFFEGVEKAALSMDTLFRVDIEAAMARFN
ncbi:MAG: aminoacyl-tRNA hydrolase [Clostridia bacterium]